MPPAVRVVSRRTVRPSSHRPRESIPLTSWDVSRLNADYSMTGLLFAPPPFSTAHLVDHLHATLADALATYYPVAGRFATEQHRDDRGDVVVGCSVFIDCAGQGVDLVHAVADGVAIADVVPPDADVPSIVQSFFALDDAINFEGFELPLLAVQVTELTDGVFLGFTMNHSLCDGMARWDFFNAWAELARAKAQAKAKPAAAEAPRTTRTPVFERRLAEAGPGAPAVLPYAGLEGLMERPQPAPPRLRARMLHFSAASLSALKEQAQRELLASGDEASAAAVTRFQALSSLMWRCVTRARARVRQRRGRQGQGNDDQETVCLFAVNNRDRLRPPLPAGYFGNALDGAWTDALGASELLAHGHGWAAAAVGRAVAAHTDAAIRGGVAAWAARPTVSFTLRLFDPTRVVIGGSPRFGVYGCDFGWGRPLAVRSGAGRASKYDGKVWLFPGRDGGGGSIDVELVLTAEHMAALEQDDEFWAAVTPDADVETNNKPARK